MQVRLPPGTPPELSSHLEHLCPLFWRLWILSHLGGFWLTEAVGVLPQRVTSGTSNRILEPRKFMLEPEELAVRGWRGQEPCWRLT